MSRDDSHATGVCHKHILINPPNKKVTHLKRVSALIVASSLLFLGACSSDEKPAEDTATTPSASADPDAFTYNFTSGETTEVNRLEPLPEDVAADIQSRFDATLFEPDAKAYTEAVEAGTVSADVDNYAAFKGLSATVGGETGKYIGGVIKVVTDCDGEPTVTWAFAAQSTSAPEPAACDSADALAEAQQIADDYVANAMGGADAWFVIEQNAQ